MYNVKSKHIVLEIPKCGSQSLATAVALGWGEHVIRCEGPYTLREMIDDQLPQHVRAKQWPNILDGIIVVAVVRNPVDRLVSQVAHAIKAPGIHLEQAMNMCWEQSDVLFKPQADFVAVPDVGEYDVRLWDIKQMEQALTFVAGRPTDVHVNRHKVGAYDEFVDAIVSHRLYDAIVAERYNRDFALWLDASKNRTLDGKVA